MPGEEIFEAIIEKTITIRIRFVNGYEFAETSHKSVGKWFFVDVVLNIKNREMVSVNKDFPNS
jgi:hypothetical protein